MADVKIDVAKLNAAFQAALPEHERKAAETEAKAQGMRGFSMSDVGGIEDTFCGAWAAIQGPIALLLRVGGWFLPASTVAMIKAVVTAINEELVPMVCGTPAPAKSDPMKRGPQGGGGN